MTDIFVRRVLLASDRAYYGLRDHRTVLAALRAGDAAEAERLRRLTIANIRSAVEQYSAFVLKRDSWTLRINERQASARMASVVSRAAAAAGSSPS